MDNWSGQVIYAVLAITAGGALCGMEKTAPSPKRAPMAMHQRPNPEANQNQIPAQAATRIVMPTSGSAFAKSYASF